VLILTKTELAKKVTEKTCLKKKDVTVAVDAVFEIIKEALSKGEKVQLIPFGSFTVKERKAREGRNPRTGDKIEIPARKVATFQPGKALRDAVAG